MVFFPEQLAVDVDGWPGGKYLGYGTAYRKRIFGFLSVAHSDHVELINHTHIKITNPETTSFWHKFRHFQRNKYI